MFGQLIEKRYIQDNDYLYAFIEDNFLNEYGKSFKKEQLKSAMQRVLNSMPQRVDTGGQKLNWIATERGIVYLFDQLVEHDLIQGGDYLHAFVERNFLNREGKPFKKGQLKSAKQKVLDSNIQDKEGLDNIINSVKTFNPQFGG